MASGNLASVSLTGGAYSSIYQVPVGKVTSYSINFCNRNGFPARIRFAVCAASGTPAVGEFREWDAVVEPGIPLERTGLVAQAGKFITVYSDVDNVSVNIDGWEE